MDQQPRNPETEPKPTMTAEEIARAEAAAVAAMLRGETPPRPELSESAPGEAEAPATPVFVPYVDDAPAEPAGEDDEDEPYIPGAMEKRIGALPEKQWKLYQGIGGALVGLASMLSLTVFTGDLSLYGVAVAALLALLLPRYLERAWNHKMPFARKVMLIAMVVGLIIMIVITGLRDGFVTIKTE